MYHTVAVWEECEQLKMPALVEEGVPVKSSIGFRIVDDSACSLISAESGLDTLALSAKHKHWEDTSYISKTVCVIQH